MTDAVRCPNCGRTVQPGDYCAACGAPMGSNRLPRARAYAVNPSEDIFQPSVTSTLFPHLPQQRTPPFRLALLAVATLLIVFGYLRLTGPFVALTSAAMPALYGIYVYEVDLYENEPIYGIATTAGVGVLLGAVWALLTGRVVGQSLALAALPQGLSVSRILLVAVVFPIVAQALMLVGPLTLRLTRTYERVLDGFAFGAASALAFVLASNIIYLVPELQSGPIAIASSTLFALRAVLHGLLVPLIDAGTSGLAAAALWLHGQKAGSTPQYGWIARIPTSLAVAAVVQVTLGLADVLVADSAAIVLIYLGVAVALVFWVRAALHVMVLMSRDGESRPSQGPDHLDPATQ